MTLESIKLVLLLFTQSRSFIWEGRRFVHQTHPTMYSRIQQDASAHRKCTMQAFAVHESPMFRFRCALRALLLSALFLGCFPKVATVMHMAPGAMHFNSEQRRFELGQRSQVIFRVVM